MTDLLVFCGMPASGITGSVCCCLIKMGQTYYLTIEQEVLCKDCALSEGVIRVREDLAVEVKPDRLLDGHRTPSLEAAQPPALTVRR